MQNIKQLLVKLEGLRTTAYQDSGGLWTIGVGHLLTHDELASGKLALSSGIIGWKHGITEGEALELLEMDLGRVMLHIEPLITTLLTSNQLSAILLFVFNIGLSAFRTSTLLKDINEGNLQDVPLQLMRWTHVGNREVPGLITRRKAEIEVWNAA